MTGHKVYFGVMEISQNYVVVIVAHLCKFTKNHFTVHLKWMDFVVGKLYLARAVYNNFKRSIEIATEIHIQGLISILRPRQVLRIPRCTEKYEPSDPANVEFTYVTLSLLSSSLVVSKLCCSVQIPQPNTQITLTISYGLSLVTLTMTDCCLSLQVFARTVRDRSCFFFISFGVSSPMLCSLSVSKVCRAFIFLLLFSCHNPPKGPSSTQLFPISVKTTLQSMSPDIIASKEITWMYCKFEIINSGFRYRIEIFY